MGLLVSIHRNEYDSIANAFYGKSKVVVVNLEGPFEPSENTPAAKVVWREAGRGGPIIVPVMESYAGMVGPMMGGTFAHTSDSRFPFNGALPIHDRFETYAQYEALSR